MHKMAIINFIKKNSVFYKFADLSAHSLPELLVIKQDIQAANKNKKEEKKINHGL